LLLTIWAVEATGRPPQVLLREGWSMNEIFLAVAARMIRAESEEDRQRQMLEGFVRA
jgi:hypothetical protein